MDERAATWPAWAAAGWWGAFAALSLSWAAGSDFAVDALARDLQLHADRRDTGFVALVGVTGLLKLAASLLALELLRPARDHVTRGRVVLLARAAGALTLTYGLVMLAEKALMALGAIDTPAELEGSVLTWYLVLWEPSFVIGGALLLAAARRA